MTKAQVRKYRFVWSQVRRRLRDDGLSPAAADARRHELHRRALGVDKSSLALTNDEFDAVLGQFFAILEPDNLELQLRQLEQPAQRRARAATLCREMVMQLTQITAAANPSAYAENYLESLARRVRGTRFDQLDEAGLGVIHGILKARLNPVPDENPF